jgi:hypothetical protein
MSSTTTKVVAIFIAAIILLALIIWGVVAMRAANRNGEANGMASSTVVMTGSDATSTTVTTGTHTAPATTAVTPTQTTTTGGATSGSVSVDSQAVGKIVTVNTSGISQPMWIVVYDTANGKAGNTLGAAMVFNGQTTVTVPLLRSTTAGKTYMVGLSTTNNGSHTYTRATTHAVGTMSSFTAQ